MQTVRRLSGRCIGIADVLRSRSRMQMNHQILDSVQAVAILVKDGGIGVFIVPSALIPETHSARLLLIALSL